MTLVPERDMFAIAEFLVANLTVIMQTAALAYRPQAYVHYFKANCELPASSMYSHI